jgi:hypothetical protein
MRQLETQDDQGGDDAIDEDQLMVGTRPGRAQAVVAPTLVQARFLLSPSRLGQVGDQFAQTAATDTGADTMRQGRAGPW